MAFRVLANNLTMSKLIIGIAVFLIVFGVISVKTDFPNAQLGLKLPSLPSSILNKPAQQVTSENTNEKKQELEKFYKEFTEIESKQDWDKLYDFVNPADKSWFSKNDLALIMEGSKPFSIQYIVKSINVEGDKGLIDRAVISCLTKGCSGKDKKEESSVKEFEYLNGQWYQQPTKAPTERATKDAAYMYANSDASTKKKLANRYGGGIDEPTKIIHIWSIVLENNPDLMAYDEALIEKHKVEASRPIVNVDAPEVNIPAQNYLTPYTPSKSINCSSNTIGSYTYTNCY